MDLSNKTPENVEFMVEEIKNKLRMANMAAIKSTHFDEEKYEDLRDIYEMVIKKSSFSISEMEAIVTELGSLRKA
ncbi:DUF1128 domain-containing protein [Aneurinibacillus tyrosinisolvens]|uniref:DUF1128 domain-containing protein n=1 Tax=Aneurinibacillus tyrosinisolvens TaxID=1443435 RepID=UPI00063F233D|nr:DUF1128 domain-containing protein [Aneurinibacillus tyrosinisolvens]